MIDQLKQQIQGVAKLRQEYAQAKAQRVKEYEQWQNDHDDIFRAEHDLGELVANAEADLRSLTLQVYALTGNKAPAPGVGIREVTELHYDPKEAFAWAVAQKSCLKFDGSAFEKLAKQDTFRETFGLAFVKVAKIAQATIATNLDKEIGNANTRNTDLFRSSPAQI